MHLILVLSAVCCIGVVQAVALGSHIKHAVNTTHTSENERPRAPTIFSPRMDFEQWKPLTGRGDPLRNDPTYDYEPPVLDRVHYWADDSRKDVTPHMPERKSEVLVLGVSSRRPSLTPRKPPRPQSRPHPSNYEDYTYMIGSQYPMTILVPPPPPPPGGHKPIPYVLTEGKLTTTHKIKTSEPVTPMGSNNMEQLTSLYALQEANLIYQSTTVSHDWVQNENQTVKFLGNSVSSDYAGWGPTTPLSEDGVNNDTQNYIFNENFDVSKHPYSFYKPMFSEAPPPPPRTSNPILQTFFPTSVPTLQTVKSTTENYLLSLENMFSTTEAPFTDTRDDFIDVTTEKQTIFQPTPLPPINTKADPSMFDMLGPMMSMPVNSPDRPLDHFYALATDNDHVITETRPDDFTKIEFMQTMQPPPVGKTTDNPATKYNEQIKINANIINSLLNKEVYSNNMIMKEAPHFLRLTTPMPTVASKVEDTEHIKSNTESPITPMYLIIQGHSKVKSYSSKSKPSLGIVDKFDNEILKQKGTQQVKHLHSSKEKYSSKKNEKTDNGRGKHAKSLKTLVSDGIGLIDIQETDIGIKYDVSDGSDVPVEIYKKGIVETDENDYTKNKNKIKRTKRDVDFDDGNAAHDEMNLRQLLSFLTEQKEKPEMANLISRALVHQSSYDTEERDRYDDDDDDDDEDEYT